MGNILGLDAPVTTKDTERGEANGLRYAVSSMQGWRLKMEDAHSLVGDLPIPGLSQSNGGNTVSFFGVYDGHGGKMTSDLAGKLIVPTFAARKEFKEYGELLKREMQSKQAPDDVEAVRLLKLALSNTFLELDEKIREAKLAERRGDRSGSTCVVVLVTSRHYVCANSGDSRACFRRDGLAKPLSFDHKPNEPAELNRIVNAGGFVRMKRVDGDLAVSRALGDFQYKMRPNTPPQLQKVSPFPDIVVYPRNMEQDEFVIVACDGIWDVVTNQECSELVRDLMDEGETDMGLVCEEMLDICLEKKSRDNMTILVAALPGSKMLKNSSQQKGVCGVAARRAKRAAGGPFIVQSKKGEVTTTTTVTAVTTSTTPAAATKTAPATTANGTKAAKAP